MSNFVWDDTALPTDKVDAISIPSGASFTNYVRAGDINAIFTALREIRDAVYKGGGVATPDSVPPAEGTHSKGDVFFNSNPTEAGHIGWVCVTTGTPGQWRKFGLIANAAGTFPASAISNAPTGNLAATTQQAANDELQADIDTRAVAANVYTKVEADARYEPIDSAYTKAESDTNYQPKDGDLTSIAGLAGTTGLLQKDSANTWSLNTTAYALDSALTAHLNDTEDAHDASAVSVSAITGLSATNVQAALAEHQGDIDALAGGGTFIERKGSGSAPPASGTYSVGDIWFNTAPAVDGNLGWVCTVAGTPGTWKEFAVIADNVVNGSAPVNDFPERKGSATAAPVSGTYAKGDIIFNSDPDDTENLGWVCVTAGTPGTWKEFGVIATDVVNGGGGGGSSNILTGSTTYDPPSLNAGDSFSTSVTVTGANVGDPVIGWGHTSILYPSAKFLSHAWVSSANTVTVTCYLLSGVGVLPGSGTLYAAVLDLTP